MPIKHYVRAKSAAANSSIFYASKRSK